LKTGCVGWRCGKSFVAGASTGSGGKNEDAGRRKGERNQNHKNQSPRQKTRHWGCWDVASGRISEEEWGEEIPLQNCKRRWGASRKGSKKGGVVTTIGFFHKGTPEGGRRLTKGQAKWLESGSRRMGGEGLFAVGSCWTPNSGHLGGQGIWQTLCSGKK